jgi:hypothetical protein
MMGKNKRMKKGQAMILAVLALGGTMLGATAIAGFLMLYQIRQSTDFESSGRALFAADTGTEWALYTYFTTSSVPLPGSTTAPFQNGATTEVICYDSTGASEVACDNTSTAAMAYAEGDDQNTRRAFSVGFDAATSTLP